MRVVAAGSADNQQGSGERRFAPASAPVLEGQTRLIWVMGQDGKPQSRRIKVGLTDGAATEVVEGNLQEGEMVITGQTISRRHGAEQSDNDRARLWRRAARWRRWRPETKSFEFRVSRSQISDLDEFRI